MTSPYWINSYGLLEGEGVIWALLPEAQTQKIITPRTVILHSQAGPTFTPWQNLIAYMRRTDIVGEAHCLVNMDGTIVQAMPFNRKADCNYRANDFAISFETQDLGCPTLATTPWSIPQLNIMTNALAAIGHHYGIPYTSPTTWYDEGIGYHSQYPEWSSYTGKTCPGAARIRQMDFVRTTAASICACDAPVAA